MSFTEILQELPRLSERRAPGASRMARVSRSRLVLRQSSREVRQCRRNTTDCKSFLFCLRYPCSAPHKALTTVPASTRWRWSVEPSAALLPQGREFGHGKLPYKRDAGLRLAFWHFDFCSLDVLLHRSSCQRSQTIFSDSRTDSRFEGLRRDCSFTASTRCAWRSTGVVRIGHY
jgi:hypothetical protein